MLAICLELKQPQPYYNLSKPKPPPLLLLVLTVKLNLPREVDDAMDLFRTLQFYARWANPLHKSPLQLLRRKQWIFFFNAKFLPLKILKANPLHVIRMINLKIFCLSYPYSSTFSGVFLFLINLCHYVRYPDDYLKIFCLSLCISHYYLFGVSLSISFFFFEQWSLFDWCILDQIIFLFLRNGESSLRICAS